ncbi:MAG: undecaprenyl/decaprenyl-phosphate alpha-N-acetylglucosaminyl 1-phosphate transferase [Spirochaetales bacterium]|nr:undecaprenyl/decaprenyl-phosphate alpha-N-acetylglucosaminyl 1-phosphate transferase [Spirochaetales bacterium]
MNVLLLLGALGVSFLAGCVFIPILLKLSHRFNWYDDTNHRKIHTGDIPRIGGVGIFLAFLLGFFLWRLVLPLFGDYLPTGKHLWPLLAGGFIIHLTGLYDDFRNIRALYKLLLQIAAACLVVFTGHTVGTVYLPFFNVEVFLGPVGYILALVWIVGVSNAVNLIDGMDGLSSTVSASVLLGLGVFFLSRGFLLSAALSFSLLGGILAFFIYNRPPAKLFMGDSGSLLIGFLLASLPLMESTHSDSIAFLLTITLLLIPILDTFAAMTRRIRRNIPVHAPDKEHLHHKLIDLGLPVNKILILVLGLSLFLVAVVLLWVFLPGLLASCCLAASWVLTLLFFLALHRQAHKKKAKDQSA